MTDLHFLGPRDALTAFPEHTDLFQLREPYPRAYLRAFVRSAEVARTRLWVFDLHYHPEGHAGILDVLQRTRVRDVRILSERMKPDDKRTLKEELEVAMELAWGIGLPVRARIRVDATLEWRDQLARDEHPFPHDRFVIADEQLWHFGYSAGGSGRCLSAASGPWNAAAKRAVEFFQEAW